MIDSWVSSAWDGVLFNPAFTIALCALWGALITTLIVCLKDVREAPGAHVRTARDILDEHLARHEIGREEYVDRRKALDYGTAIV